MGVTQRLLICALLLGVAWLSTCVIGPCHADTEALVWDFTQSSPELYWANQKDNCEPTRKEIPTYLKHHSTLRIRVRGLNSSAYRVKATAHQEQFYINSDLGTRLGDFSGTDQQAPQTNSGAKPGDGSTPNENPTETPGQTGTNVTGLLPGVIGMGVDTGPTVAAGPVTTTLPDPDTILRDVNRKSQELNDVGQALRRELAERESLLVVMRQACWKLGDTRYLCLPVVDYPTSDTAGFSYLRTCLKKMRSSLSAMMRATSDCYIPVYDAAKCSAQSAKGSPEEQQLTCQVSNLEKAWADFWTNYTTVTASLDTIIVMPEYVEDNVLLTGDEVNLKLTCEKIATATQVVRGSVVATPIVGYDGKVAAWDYVFCLDGKTAERKFILRSGFKTDFSAGLAASRLVDRNYGPVSSSAGGTTVFTVAEPFNVDKYKILPAALAHVYWRGIPLALSVGIATDDLTKPQLLMGASVFLGCDQKRWVFTYGIAAGSVQRLSPRYAIGQQVTNEQTVVTRDENSLSQFFALTYNW